MVGAPEESMDFAFQPNSKFALLAVENVYTETNGTHRRLADGTWILPSVPLSDLGVWRAWIGSIAAERLAGANLVLLREETDARPDIVDAVHHKLDDDLTRLFYLLQLADVLEYDNAESLLGSSVNGQQRVRTMSNLRRFLPSKGYSRQPATVARFEEAIALRTGARGLEVSGSADRIVRGMNVLFDGLAQNTGQERLHEFVRSLEALIIPDQGKTKKQFVHRCQTFTAGSEVETVLAEAFDMRSDTEHLHDWQRSLEKYKPVDRENIACLRTRQMERLATTAYAAIFKTPTVRQHFASEASQSAFWQLSEAERQVIWGKPIDLAAEPLVERYDQWNRAM
jgi:hypothetical protein